MEFNWFYLCYALPFFSLFIFCYALPLLGLRIFAVNYASWTTFAASMRFFEMSLLCVTTFWSKFDMYFGASWSNFDVFCWHGSNQKTKIFAEGKFFWGEPWLRPFFLLYPGFTDICLSPCGKNVYWNQLKRRKTNRKSTINQYSASGTT